MLLLRDINADLVEVIKLIHFVVVVVVGFMHTVRTLFLVAFPE